MRAGGGWIVVAVVASGCGRIGFATVPPDSSPVLADAFDDTMFTALETLVVPVDGSSVSSVAVLSSSGTYRLRASGVITCGGVGDQMGDAEYHDFTNPTDNNSLNGLDYGISIDSPVVGQKTIHWGAYTPTHVYEVDYVGRDQVVSANLHDGQYTDNSGTFMVTVLQQTP